MNKSSCLVECTDGEAAVAVTAGSTTAAKAAHFALLLAGVYNIIFAMVVWADFGETHVPAHAQRETDN